MNEMTPAEIVLVSRIKATFPARLADMLPSDEQVAHIVRATTTTFKMDVDAAFAWVSLSLMHLAEEGEMDDYEVRLMQHRAKLYWGKEVAV
jgi:hypothetical protein